MPHFRGIVRRNSSSTSYPLGFQGEIAPSLREHFGLRLAMELAVNVKSKLLTFGEPQKSLCCQAGSGRRAGGLRGSVQFTVNLNDAEWLRLPEVPVTVMVKVPAGVPEGGAGVTVSEAVWLAPA